MRRVFKTRHFSRWMQKTDLTDQDLCRAVSEMTDGLIDADLGGGVVKKRVALPGRGKRGGARTLVATNKGSRWFFVVGFEKSERSNIDAQELAALKMLASDLLKRSAADLSQQVRSNALVEICHESQDQDEKPHSRRRS